MKRLILLILLVMLVVCLAVMDVSCDHNQYVGMYYGVGADESAWLELKAGGTFQSIFGMSGSWEVKGNQLTLIEPFGHEELIIEDGKIMTQTGEVLWVKQ